MKNYPLLFTKTGHRWHNWTKTYLKQLDSEICSLFHYVQYFTPDYYQRDDIFDNDSEEIDISILNYREFSILTKEKYDTLTQQIIPTGSRIVSRAQSEGQKDTQYSENRQNPLLYFIQPIGWASYYIPSFYSGEARFQYDQYAEETHGISMVFSPEFYSRRWYLTSNNQFNSNSRELTYLSSLIIENIRTPLIRDKVGTEWLNDSSNIPMKQTYFNDTFEEIIISERVYTYSQTKIAGSNNAVYNIALREGSKWPSGGHVELY